MRRRVDRCIGCAECIWCYRKGSFYTALVCDYCENEEETLYRDKGDEVCKECLLYRHMEGEGICKECGDFEMLYNGLCKSCFLDDQERVIIDD